MFQYSLRLLHSSSGPLLSSAALSRVQRTIKSLSRSRKGFRLLRCTYSLPDIIAFASSSSTTSERLLALAEQCNNVLGFCNDLLDDVAFLGRLGFGRSSIASWADEVAEKIWFITCFFDIFFLLVQLRRINASLRLASVGTGSAHELRMLQGKRFMVLVSLLKMFGDLTIATSYACKLPLSSRAIACSGLVSGIASFYKLWAKAVPAHKP